MTWASRGLSAVLLLLAVATPGGAGQVEDELRAGWVGAWVAIQTEVRSDCLDCYTENRVTGGVVASDGGRPFAAGELGRVSDLDVRRSRVDLGIEFAEPLLVNAPHGKFVLVEKRPCRIELQIEIDREEMKQRSATVIEERLGKVLERFPTLAQARSSASWNGRTTEPLPKDHEARLREVREWQKSWEDRARVAALEAVRATMPRRKDIAYLGGFSRGMESVDDSEWGGCAELSLSPLPSVPSSAGDLGITEAEKRTLGWSDGIAFAAALRMLGSMAQCRASPAEGGE